MTTHQSTYIYLVGFMCSGKSAVGQHLASTLDWHFRDTDLEIEKRSGISVQEIFSQHGERAFRGYEQQLLMDMLSFPKRSVIATGGGILTIPNAIPHMKKTGQRIYLQASFETLLQRLKRSYPRPLGKFRSNEDIENLYKLYLSRIALYEQSEHTIDTNSLDIDSITQHILSIEQIKDYFF